MERVATQGLCLGTSVDVIPTGPLGLDPNLDPWLWSWTVLFLLTKNGISDLAKGPPPPPHTHTQVHGMDQGTLGLSILVKG